MSDYFKKVNLLDDASRVALFFDSMQDVQAFSTDTIENYANNRPRFNDVNKYKIANVEKLVSKQIRSNGITWYGTTDSSWATQEITRFLRSDEIDNALRSIRTRTARINIKDIEQKKKITFTEKDIGIFSFDLASLGLIRAYEYYSPYTKGLVDPYLIDSYENQNGDLIFFYVGTPYIPRHEVFYSIKDACYISPILGRKVEISELEEVLPVNAGSPITFFYPEQTEIPRHDVERRQVVNEDGQKKFSSTYKKSFIYLPKVKNKLPRIDLIVPMAYVGSVTANEMFWNAICVISIIEKLNELKLNFRLIASRSFIDPRMTKQIYNFINLKNDNQNIDRNTIATLVSDARVYRLLFFKLSISAQIEFGLEQGIDDDIISYPIKDQTLIKNAYINYLSKQTNPSDIEASKNRNSKIIVGLSLSEDEAVENYENVMRQIENQIQI